MANKSRRVGSCSFVKTKPTGFSIAVPFTWHHAAGEVTDLKQQLQGKRQRRRWGDTVNALSTSFASLGGSFLS